MKYLLLGSSIVFFAHAPDVAPLLAVTRTRISIFIDRYMRFSLFASYHKTKARNVVFPSELVTSSPTVPVQRKTCNNPLIVLAQLHLLINPRRDTDQYFAWFEFWIEITEKSKQNSVSKKCYFLKEITDKHKTGHFRDKG